MNHLHRTGAVLATCAVSLGIALAAPATTLAGGHQIECNGTITGQTLNGGVVVPAGDSCTLGNDVVWGGITVSGTIQATDTTVHGGFVIDGGSASGEQCGDSVDGGLYVTNVENPGASFVFGDAQTGCAGPTVSGGIDFSGNPNVGTLQLEGATVSGQLKDAANTAAGNVLSGDSVTGSARCVDDAVAPVNADTSAANAYSSNTGCPA